MISEDDSKKNVEQELIDLRQRVAELEATESEREEKERRELESRRKRAKNKARMLAGLPIFLGVIIFILNRTYFMQFFNTENRALGLPLIGTAILLVAASYPALRWSFSVIESGRKTSGVLFVVLVFVFMIFPAVLIVVLGPAALLLLRKRAGVMIEEVFVCLVSIANLHA